MCQRPTWHTVSSASTAGIRRARYSDAFCAFWVREYNDFLTDTLKVEPQNLLYAPERDPFELYDRLEKLMKDYKDTLRLIEGQICFGFALLTSKLLALGVLLIGLKYNDEVQVYNVNSSKYDIADKRKIIEANEHSEPFLMWINGEPYV